MAQKLGVYRCELCGNIVEVFSAGGGTLACCGQPMAFLNENTVDASKEKHIPVVEKAPGGIKVKVGSVPHPMEEKHYIQWIEVIAGEKVYREHLKPGAAPEAVFPIQDENVVVREYCNLHIEGDA